jgi:hypothetical protein
MTKPKELGLRAGGGGKRLVCVKRKPWWILGFVFFCSDRPLQSRRFTAGKETEEEKWGETRKRAQSPGARPSAHAPLTLGGRPRTENRRRPKAIALSGVGCESKLWGEQVVIAVAALALRFLAVTFAMERGGVEWIGGCISDSGVLI